MVMNELYVSLVSPFSVFHPASVRELLIIPQDFPALPQKQLCERDSIRFGFLPELCSQEFVPGTSSIALILLTLLPSDY